MRFLSHHRTEALVLLVVMAVAVGFRFWALDRVPPGLYPDEAMNGNDAVAAAESGEYRMFYPDNNGREGLFINLQSLAVRWFGPEPGSLRGVSALMGVLTVLGTYLLTRRLFNNWGLAALAAFLLAVGFWHVNFSRIGFRAVMSPMFAVWSFYYLYTALQTNRLWHWGVAGALMGLGMHTYIAFRILPVAALFLLVVYWHAVRKDFAHGRYRFTRQQVASGVAMGVAAFIITVLPLAWYFTSNPGTFTGRAGQVSVFASDEPLRDAAVNVVRTLGMFVYRGDLNWRHNLSGEPLLFWPVAALFAVGLARSLLKVGRVLRTHGHFSSVHALLLGWFFIGLIPAFVSNEGIPHALRALPVAPVVYIFAAEGLWWLYILVRRAYEARDARLVCIPDYLVPGTHGHDRCTSRGRSVALFTLCVVLAALAVRDARTYFVTWGASASAASAFNQDYVELASRINAVPAGTPVLVVVQAGGVHVNGIPMPAQTVMFMTDTATAEKQRARNVRYVRGDEFRPGSAARGTEIFYIR
ncbi:MAG TPA: glycosyltransferase family 39 protein [Candidatus Paceibacterota bacterium]|nr:glycosyltransferase family 39 protein [Candidatus Paceibacterota bacterium]